MKSNSGIRQSLGVVLLGLSFTIGNSHGQTLQQMSDIQLQAFVSQLQSTPQLSATDAPKTGNFFSLAHPEWPPLPCNPGVPVWQVGDSFILDDAGISANGLMSTSEGSLSGPIDFGPGDSSPADSPYTPPDISNYAKFMAQSFSVIDTNDPSIDPALLNACAGFSDTSSDPTLQIAQYAPGCLVMKASHFDYSSEPRNFAVVVCDKLDTPLFKSIDLFAPSNNVQNGGWLVQGSVPSWQVADPMYLVVSNISTVYNAFFRVIPYSGPVVTLAGTNNPYDTVSNLVSLQATVTDLSGVTNEGWKINIDGASARYSLGPNNTFTFDTKYTPNGMDNIYLTANNQARIFDPINPPDNSQVFFSASGSIPLDFENDQFLAFASDWCPPEAGINYIYYYLSKAQGFAYTISSPVNGRVVASSSGSVPGSGYVAIPWNMTEADGVTAYSNDTYVVTFTAYDPVTWVSTNSLDKGGNIRVPAGCFLTYEWEDPSTTTGLFLNDRADTAIAGSLLYLYQDIYDPWGLTEYYDWMVGPNRDWAQCKPYNAAYKSFQGIMAYGMTNSQCFSELTIAQAHGSGASIGGGPYLSDKFYSLDLKKWTTFCETPHNWRLRKACVFTCYNADLSLSTADGSYPSWPDACGIRDTGLQQTSLTYKNCGLFFAGGLPQGYINAETSAVQATADVAEMVDQAWVCGANEWPGACDPTYSFKFAVLATMGMYPDLVKAAPALAGFPLCVYDAWQDEALRNLDTSGVKTR
ncbi:MAG: hypothetical protein P4N59_11300 [Negativicutes bacterium]|nr:hypothetical protein [Negativicutes bacterium]